jgi:hypothetical protein
MGPDDWWSPISPTQFGALGVWDSRVANTRHLLLRVPERRLDVSTTPTFGQIGNESPTTNTKDSRLLEEM